MPSLDSPGKATSERARLEEELSASLLRALRFFLMDVEKLAMAPAPAMTASLFDGGNRGHGLTLGGVLGKWTHAARTAIKPVARVFGVHDLTDEAIAAHPYLSQMFDRMSRSDLPEKAYSAARAVLSEAATQGWAHDKVALEMGRAMNAWTATLVPGRDGPVPEGMSWAAQMQRIARTESTAAYNFSAIERLSAQGYPQKQWVAHHDKITRDTHLAADGQVVPLTAAFIVGGQALMVPGDPSGSPAVTYNCRCVLVGTGFDMGSEMPIGQAMSGTNPLYGEQTQASVNCQKCVLAYELRRRGEEVTANLGSAGNLLKGIRVWFDGYSPHVQDLSFLSRDTSPTWIHRLVSKDIRLHNKPGARGVLSVKWQNVLSGHVISWELDDLGEVRFYDVQKGVEVFKTSPFWGKLDWSYLEWERLDDLPITQEAYSAVSR